MWPAAAIAVAALSAPMPSTATAQTPEGICPLVAGPYAYQAAITPLLGGLITADGPVTPGGGATAAARQALGAQFTGLWLDTARQGWSVAFSPGPLDATAARAAIRERLADQFAPDQVAFLDSTLNVLPDKFSEAELLAVHAQLVARMRASGWVMSVGIGCFEAGGWRVLVTRYGVSQTPEVVAETEALVEPFGDMVRLSFAESIPEATVLPVPEPPAPQPPVAIRVTDYASVPRARRCARGKVTVRARRSAELRSITLAAGKRRARARAGGKAQLKLKARRTRVVVTVKLRDGRSAKQTFTFRRC